VDKKYSYSSKDSYFWKATKEGAQVYLETSLPVYQRKDVKRRFIIKAFFVLFKDGRIGFNKTMISGQFDPTSTNDRWKMITQKTFDRAEKKYMTIEKEDKSKLIFVMG